MKVKAIMTGFNNQLVGNNEDSVKAFQDFFGVLFPFTVKEKKLSDEKQLEMLKKEVQKGAIMVTPSAPTNPLREAAKRMQAPDEFRKQLQKKIAEKKGSK